MAVTAVPYTNAPVAAFRQQINDIAAAGNDTKVALLTNAYTPNQNTHTSWADVSANEVSAGGGYDAGGKALTSKSLTGSAGVATFDADNLTWESSTITARFAVLYDDEPAADADKKLIGYVDFGEDKESVDGDFNINWHNDGILQISVT